MPTDAERYNLLLQALATGIEDIRKAFEVCIEQAVAVGSGYPKMQSGRRSEEAGQFRVQLRHDLFKAGIGFEWLLRRAQAVALTDHRLGWLTGARGDDTTEQFRAEGYH
jgi:hypothetical protein